MRNLLIVQLLIVFSVIVVSQASMAADWLVLPSQYTHDPATGLRVSQYAPTPTPTGPLATDFRSSGYTHLRSSLNFGQSADNYHRVQQWGPPVQPYGEWRFPNRPYSVPYSQWGAPYAGLGTNVFGGIGLGGVNFNGYGYPGGYPATGDPNGNGVQPPVPGQPPVGPPSQGPFPIDPQFPGANPYPGSNSQILDGYHPVYRD
jgi:hypothetical protein